MAWAQLAIDIDESVVHISALVADGANKEEAVSEQYQLLLAVFATLRGVSLDPVTHVRSLKKHSEINCRSLQHCGIDLQMVATVDNIADIFTEYIGPQRLRYLLSKPCGLAEVSGEQEFKQECYQHEED